MTKGQETIYAIFTVLLGAKLGLYSNTYWVSIWLALIVTLRLAINRAIPGAKQKKSRISC